MKFYRPDDNGLVALSTGPDPVPSASQVLVRVQAVSFNRVDLIYLSRPGSGWVPGIDVVGEVITTAADGSGPAAGTRVVGTARTGGGAAELAVLETGQLTSVPEDVPVAAAAALPLAGLTAFRVVRAAGSLLGKRVLATGAGGGVGHYLVELATGAGAAVTAVAGSGHGRLRELGAADAVARVDAASGEFDVVFESVGGQSFADALAVTAPFGQLFWHGQASGEPVTIDYFGLVAGPRGVTIRQFLWAGPAYRDADDLRTLLALVRVGRLHPELGSVRGWDELSEALIDVRDRRIRGKAVVTR